MSDGDDKKKNEKKEPGSSNNEAQPSNEEKKVKKSLRFTFPDDVRSEESFTSALSNELIDENIEDQDEYEYEQDGDFILRSKSSVSVLKKYVLTPLHHSSPRTAKMEFCFETFSDDDDFKSLLACSSSKQLLEISRDSPTPSEADINLINATYLRRLGAVKEAINNGANVNTHRDMQTSLLIAAEIGDARLVSYLVTVPNINLDCQNDFGQTPLTVAIRNAFDRIVRLLLIHKADVNLADNMGRTPLHSALYERRVGLVKLLLTYDADYERPDCFEERPIYTAAVKKPHLDCLLTLLKTGANPDYINITRIPLLSRAVLHAINFKIIEALVQYGASVNSQDLVSGKTPLHFAAQTNNLQVVKFLVSKGADINIKNKYDFNAYEEALFHGSIEVIKFLADKTQNLKVKKFASINLDPFFLRREFFDTKEPEKKKRKKKKE